MTESELEGTVIIGAGIIGCATAFYLTELGGTRPETIHLVEASPELFASASGKSGGFLASDWFGPPTASLGELSFRLHKELADRFDGYQNWGYNRSTGTSLLEGNRSDAQGDPDWLSEGTSRANAAATHEFFGDKLGPAWLRQRSGDQVETIGEDGSVAQVDPLRLSQFLLREAQSRGVKLHHPAKAIDLAADAAGHMSTVTLQLAAREHLSIPCSRLLITSGAWTPSVFKTLFPASRLRLPISQLAGHSLVVKSPRWAREHETSGCHAVFTSLRSGFSPEIFSRVGEEIYIAGLNDPALPLPDDVASFPAAASDPASVEQLRTVAEALLGRDGTDVSDLQVLREGLCFRPVTPRGVPILCRVPDRLLGGSRATRSGGRGGVFVAAGHGPWGISHSVGTGLVMAEMLEGRETSADVRLLGMQ